MPINTHAQTARQNPALLHTLNDVAESLRLSRRTVESLIASGQLRSVTIGRSRRVNADDLAEFAARGTGEAIAESERR